MTAPESREGRGGVNPWLRVLAVCGALGLAAFCVAVAGRAWRGERAFAAGRAAHAAGNLSAAVAAYREAAAMGNVEAAVERARLALALRDWEEAGRSLDRAMALSPARGYPHQLRAVLEEERPGPWDAGREERVLGACRTAVALEPVRAATWEGCAGILLRLYARRRGAWDGARAGVVLGELLQAHGEALSRQPGEAERLLQGVLTGGGGPEILVEISGRDGGSAALAAAARLLLAHGLWDETEQGYWRAAEARGAVPAFAAAAAAALAARGRHREALGAARRGLAVAPGDETLLGRAAASAARLPAPAAPHPPGRGD